MLAPFRRRVCVLDAMLQVGMNQIFGQRLEGLARRDKLHEDFRAVAVLGQHPLDGVQLADDAANAQFLRVPLTPRMAVRFHAISIRGGTSRFNPVLAS